jgi:hypothetical protein
MKKQREKEDEDDGRPWNEERWERFLQESEVRSAKFGELLETFMDDPNCDLLISREMGWDKPSDGDENEDELPDVEEINRLCEEAVNDPEIEREMAESRAALEAMPAYRRGYAFGLKTHRALKQLMESKDADLAEDAAEASINAHIVAAKLAGSHGMGYEDDTLCGTICVVKRSLAAANTCLEALERLRGRGITDKRLDALLVEGKEVRRLVEEHIAELRSRVWW